VAVAVTGIARDLRRRAPPHVDQDLEAMPVERQPLVRDDGREGLGEDTPALGGRLGVVGPHSSHGPLLDSRAR